MPFHLQSTKGELELAGLAAICTQDNWKVKHHHQQEVNSFSSSNNTEPTSVLHMRRSPSPPTSASTLSSSFNGGSAAGNSADNTATPTTTTTAAASHIEKKEEWANELQPIPSGLEIVAETERCGLGLGDWETMWPESAASPSQEHSLLRWIEGDIDDGSFGLKQLLQSGSTYDGNSNSPLDFEGNAGLGIVDQGPGFEPISNMIAGTGTSLGAFPGSGFNGNGKIGTVVAPQPQPPPPPPTTATGGASSGLGVNVSQKLATATTITNNSNCNIQSPVFNNLGLPVSLPSGMIYQSQQQQFVEGQEEKPQILIPQVLMSQQQVQASQNPSFFLPLPYGQQEQHLLQPQPKRHSPGSLDSPSHQIPKLPFSDPGHEFLLRKQPHVGVGLGFSPQGMQFLPQHLQQQKPLMMAKQKVLGPGEEMAQHQHPHQLQQQQQQQHALLDQLFKAAELIGTGNFSNAQGILARLNHQLSPVGKPLHRAAFYFKEALQLLLLTNNPVSSPPPRSPTPFDVIFKLGAYKVFSDVSPLIQFVNFTCNQALLEALDDADRIHIVDFDIGFGAQWASFMQELPMRNRGAPALRITAFASPLTHHPVELGLMRDNLTQFANEIGVSFELEVVNFDSLEQMAYSFPMFRSNESEVVAVNFPIWSSSNQPSAMPSLLRFVKQLSPKIVVSLDRGCDRSDLPFPQHILHALHSYINLLESLDALNVSSDAVNKIERFLLQPRIESTVLGRLRAPEKMPLWKTLFASAGFSPITFSNFAETQAEYVVKRTQVRGFHVEKRQASLVLCWQRRELISASAWRC